jgi:hypothetical protein
MCYETQAGCIRAPVRLGEINLRPLSVAPASTYASFAETTQNGSVWVLTRLDQPQVNESCSLHPVIPTRAAHRYDGPLSVRGLKTLSSHAAESLLKAGHLTGHNESDELKLDFDARVSIDLVFKKNTSDKFWSIAACLTVIDQS